MFSYVASFIDRDMFMRYSGEGVGHKSTRRALRDARFGNPYEVDGAEWIDEDDTVLAAGRNDLEDGHTSDTMDTTEGESEGESSESLEHDDDVTY